jgi:hypothetical protein
MTIFLWVLVVHVIEIALVAGYLLISKNIKLERAIVSQQQYIDAISIIIDNSDQIIKDLDVRGAFEADDEIGQFFKNLKEIQIILNDFKTSKN